MPAKNSPEPTGFAQVQAQLLVPGQTQPLNLDTILVFKEASFKENVFSGIAEYTLTYATTSLDFVEKALKACELSGTPQLQFRYGFGDATHMRWLAWQTGLVKQVTSMPLNVGQQAGHNVLIHVGNALYTATRAKKTVIRKGFISDIVNQIATENGLQVVIEPTQNQFFYIQSYMDDVSFITARLQPRAANAKGFGNYVFYVRDDILHFHTPDYQATYSEFDYYDSPHHHMGENSLGQLLYDEGVSGTRLVVHDPYTAQTKELFSDPTKALTLANTLPQFDSVVNGQRNITYHLSQNQPEESVNIGQNLYERARMNAFKATITTDKIFDVRAGNFMNLVVSPSNKQTSTWSGVYLVLDTTYVIKQGAISAILTVTRGETSTTLGQINTQGPDNQLTPQTSAPGHPINLRDMQDSQVTKGAPTTTGNNTTYAEVMDPDTALD